MMEHFDSDNHHWGAQLAKALDNAISVGSLECAKRSPEAWRLADCGNLSLGVTLGTHHETGAEVFQFNEDRFRHTLILGRTGAGKSNHIQQMEREDIRSGAGVFILAAHEDDALYPLSCVPDERLDDVVLIDASNPEYLPRMNPFDVDTSDRGAVDKAVEDVLELVTMDCEHSWAGPRFEHRLRNAAELLFSDPEGGSAHCVNDLNKALTDPEFVKGLLKFVTNKEVYDFWTKVFPQEQKSSESGDVSAWVLAKMSRFATDHVLGHFFGAGKSTVDIKSVVDEGKILIAYVPEERIGSIAARTICKWLVMQLRDAIMGRRADSGVWRGLNYGFYGGGSAVSQDGGLDPFFVYVDEFAKFATTDFDALLAESRKQRVGFVLSTQTLSQAHVYDRQDGRTTSRLQEAILGNVGSIICYPMGAPDAEMLSCQFDVDVDKLKRIERYRPLARLCMDNRINRPGTLEVGARPAPDNPAIASLAAMNQVISGSWVEVEYYPDKGAFLRMLDDGMARQSCVKAPNDHLDFADGCVLGEPDQPAEEDGGAGLPAADRSPVAALSLDASGDDAPAEARGDEASGSLERSCGPRRPGCSEDGLGLAYRFLDPVTGAPVWSTDRGEADRISSGLFEAVWVLYQDGEIDRAATAAEYQEELEVRIGQRIAKGLSRAQLNEFDSISEQSEATRWLELNRPDYRDIVAMTVKEMERGIVLPPEDDNLLGGEGVPDA